METNAPSEGMLLKAKVIFKEFNCFDTIYLTADCWYPNAISAQETASRSNDKTIVLITRKMVEEWDAMQEQSVSTEERELVDSSTEMKGSPIYREAMIESMLLTASCVFRQHTTCDLLYFTEDLKCATLEENAISNAALLEQKKITKITRAQVEEWEKETLNKESESDILQRLSQMGKSRPEAEKQQTFAEFMKISGESFLQMWHMLGCEKEMCATLNFDGKEYFLSFVPAQMVPFYCRTEEEKEKAKRKEAIEFLESIRSYELGIGQQIALDERSSEDLYVMFIQDRILKESLNHAVNGCDLITVGFSQDANDEPILSGGFYRGFPSDDNILIYPFHKMPPNGGQ